MPRAPHHGSRARGADAETIRASGLEEGSRFARVAVILERLGAFELVLEEEAAERARARDATTDSGKDSGKDASTDPTDREDAGTDPEVTKFNVTAVSSIGSTQIKVAFDAPPNTTEATRRSPT